MHRIGAMMDGSTEPVGAAPRSGPRIEPRALRPCAECSAPATADVVFEVDGLEREVRLCDEHLTELLGGARRLPRGRG